MSDKDTSGPELGKPLLNEPSKVAFLVGAGVSFPAPARVPTVLQFISDTLLAAEERLAKSDSRAFRNLASELNRRKNGICKMRFELYASLYIEYIDPSISALTWPMKTATPNHYHYFLAKAMCLGSIVMTTNFDRLIEAAAEALGVERYDPVVPLRGYDFSRTEEAPRFFKLHGELGGDLPSFLATIEAVLSNSYFFERELDHYRALRSALRNKCVIVFGYSGSDNFDVMPLLSDAEPRVIIWLIHSADLSEGNKMADRVRTLLPEANIHFEIGPTDATLPRLIGEVFGYDKARIPVDEIHESGNLKSRTASIYFSDWDAALFASEVLYCAGFGDEMIQSWRGNLPDAYSSEGQALSTVIGRHYLQTGRTVQLVAFLAYYTSFRFVDSERGKRVQYYMALAFEILGRKHDAEVIFRHLENVNLPRDLALGLHAHNNVIKKATRGLKSLEETSAQLYRAGLYRELLVFVCNYSVTVDLSSLNEPELRQLRSIVEFCLEIAVSLSMPIAQKLRIGRSRVIQPIEGMREQAYAELLELLRDSGESLIEAGFDGYRNPTYLKIALWISANESNAPDEQVCQVFSILSSKRSMELFRNHSPASHLSAILYVYSRLIDRGLEEYTSLRHVLARLSSVSTHKKAVRALERLLFSTTCSNEEIVESIDILVASGANIMPEVAFLIDKDLGNREENMQDLISETVLAEAERLNTVMENLAKSEQARLGGDLALALECLERSPDQFVEIWEERADCLLSLDKFVEAKAAASRVLAMRGDSYVGHYVLGFCLLRECEPSEAAAHFKAANSIHPGNPEVLRCLSCSLYDAEQYEELFDLLGSLDRSILRYRLGPCANIDRLSVHSKLQRRLDLSEKLLLVLKRLYDDLGVLKTPGILHQLYSGTHPFRFLEDPTTSVIGEPPNQRAAQGDK